MCQRSAELVSSRLLSHRPHHQPAAGEDEEALQRGEVPQPPLAPGLSSSSTPSSHTLVHQKSGKLTFSYIKFGLKIINDRLFLHSLV